MRIQRVAFLGIRGLADSSFDFSNPSATAPHDLVIVTGPSASGKTRALEAIVAAKEVIAPYGPIMAGEPWIAAGSLVSKIVISFYLDEEERTYAGATSAVLEGEATFFPKRTSRRADDGLIAVLERYEHGKKTGKVEYFPASRRLPPYGPFHGTGQLEQRLLRSSKDARKYSAVVRFLREIEDAPEIAQVFAERLAALTPTCRYERTGSSEGMPRVFTSHGRSRLSPTEISDSEADAVLFAATATAIDLHRSIVLIDRPEIYADPGNLKGFVKGLAELGQGNQLILASSSPELYAAAPEAHIIRTEEA